MTPNDPRQRGLFAGLNRQHGRGHLYRAVLEAVAYEYGLYLRAVRDLHRELGEVTVRGVGGGSGSSLWCQIKADVLGVEYRPLVRQEGGALGSAILAGRAVGLIGDMASSAERFNELQPGYQPDAMAARAYHGAVDAYQELLGAVGKLSESSLVSA